MVFINKRSIIKKCNTLSEYYIGLGVEWKAMAKSVKQNKVTEDIAVFVNKKIRGELENKEMKKQENVYNAIIDSLVGNLNNWEKAKLMDTLEVGRFCEVVEFLKMKELKEKKK